MRCIRGNTPVFCVYRHSLYSEMQHVCVHMQTLMCLLVISHHKCILLYRASIDGHVYVKLIEKTDFIREDPQA